MSTIEIHTSKLEHSSALLPRLLLIMALLSALTLPVMAVLLDSYDYIHGWVSAHFATIAKSYLEHGIVALGGVPIQNNPPLTALPDAYLNWPPLYPLLLSAVFAIFGESVLVHHLFAATINLSLGAVVALVIYRAFGRTAASIAAIAFFNAPIIAQYGHIGSQLHLALALCAASLLLFGRAIEARNDGRQLNRKIAAAGCAVYVLAVFSSWEPVLAAPGLAIATLVMRDWPGFRLAILYGICAFLAVCAVFGLYWAEYDYFGDAIIHRILLRAGFDVTYDPSVSAMFSSPHFIAESHEPPDTVGPGYIGHVTYKALLAQGMIGFAGLLFAYTAPIWKRGANTVAYSIVGLLTVYVLWAVLMSQHLAGHHYQWLLLTPVTAIAAGAVTAGLLERNKAGLEWFSYSPAMILVLCGALCVVAIGGRAAVTANLLHNHRPDTSAEIQFAKHIRDVTEPGSIVAHAGPSMVPVYYSGRHIVRSVWDEATLAEHRSAIETLCTDCPVYMAIPNGYRAEFSDFMSKNEAHSVDEFGTLIRLR